MKCEDCGNENGVTVLQTIKGQRKGDEIVIKFNAGVGTVNGRVLCWFCAFPTVGRHL